MLAKSVIAPAPPMIAPSATRRAAPLDGVGTRRPAANSTSKPTMTPPNHSTPLASAGAITRSPLHQTPRRQEQRQQGQAEEIADIGQKHRAGRDRLEVADQR